MSLAEILAVIQIVIGVLSMVISLVTLNAVKTINRSNQIAIGKQIKQKNKQ